MFLWLSSPTILFRLFSKVENTLKEIPAKKIHPVDSIDRWLKMKYPRIGNCNGALFRFDPVLSIRTSSPLWAHRNVHCGIQNIVWMKETPIGREWNWRAQQSVKGMTVAELWKDSTIRKVCEFPRIMWWIAKKKEKKNKKYNAEKARHFESRHELSTFFFRV